MAGTGSPSAWLTAKYEIQGGHPSKRVFGRWERHHIRKFDLALAAFSSSAPLHQIRFIRELREQASRPTQRTRRRRSARDVDAAPGGVASDWL